MVSEKFYPSLDGTTRTFMSDIVIKSEQYIQVYNYKYDAGGVDGQWVSDANGHYNNTQADTGYFVRTINSPQADDLIVLTYWALVNNTVAFYKAPPTGTTVVLEVATTPEELGNVLAGSAVQQAEDARDLAQAAQAAAELAQTGAETAETNATTQATNAATSATASATSATASATSATASAASATAAATSETNAGTSETNASASATAAAASATSASTSATNASTSETNAATSASSASTSATNAATSEANAATSEANAAASAALAATFDPTSYYTKTNLDGGQLDNRYYTETEVDTALALKAPIASPTFTGNVTLPAVTETVYALSSSPAGTLTLDATNGTVQYCTLTEAITTFTVSLSSGQYVFLRLLAGDTYAVTWGTIDWVGGTAPTLTAEDAIVFWKEGTAVYASYLGTLVQA